MGITYTASPCLEMTRPLWKVRPRAAADVSDGPWSLHRVACARKSPLTLNDWCPRTGTWTRLTQAGTDNDLYRQMGLLGFSGIE
jgi:hypothetical protein